MSCFYIVYWISCLKSWTFCRNNVSHAPSLIFVHLFQVVFFISLVFWKEAGFSVTHVCWGMCSLEGARLTSEQLESRPYHACQEPVFGAVDAPVCGGPDTAASFSFYWAASSACSDVSRFHLHHFRCDKLVSELRVFFLAPLPQHIVLCSLNVENIEVTLQCHIAIPETPKSYWISETCFLSILQDHGSWCFVNK